MRDWQSIGPDLFRFVDTCCVYALRVGRRARLIDLGSGATLDALADIGVDSVERCDITHAHRDQCGGAARALAAGIPVHFPTAAQRHVDAADRGDFQRPAPGHLAYPWPFKPPPPIPGARFDLVPQHRPEGWGPFDLQPLAAPCHTDHDLAWLVDRDGESWLFCGDAMHSRGKVHEPYHLESDHYTGAGARRAADTLCALRNLRADHVCPSHGPVTSEAVWDAFSVTIERLRALADLKDTCLPRRPAVQRLARPRSDTFVQLSEHLWMWNNSYLLASDEGGVLMVDVQAPPPPAFHEGYREVFGERPIEVALITHIHCDHVMGVAALREQHDLRCWALERLVTGIERPYDVARPWLHDQPTRVDRPLADGERGRWREYELTAHWFPGQTDLHAGYATRVDGHEVVFAGDNFYPPQQWGGTGGLTGYNGGHPALWRRSAELLLHLEPEWVLASHLQPFPYRRADFEAVVEWSERVAAAMAELAPDGCLERHHDPHFAAVHPYVQAGSGPMTMKVSLHNPYDRARRVRVTPHLPDGVSGDARTWEGELAPGEGAWPSWLLAADPPLTAPALVTFEVRFDDEPDGPSAECYLRPGTTAPARS